MKCHTSGSYLGVSAADKAYMPVITRRKSIEEKILEQEVKKIDTVRVRPVLIREIYPLPDHFLSSRLVFGEPTKDNKAPQEYVSDSASGVIELLHIGNGIDTLLGSLRDSKLCFNGKLIFGDQVVRVTYARTDEEIAQAISKRQYDMVSIGFNKNDKLNKNGKLFAEQLLGYFKDEGIIQRKTPITTFSKSKTPVFIDHTNVVCASDKGDLSVSLADDIASFIRDPNLIPIRSVVTIDLTKRHEIKRLQQESNAYFGRKPIDYI